MLLAGSEHLADLRDEDSAFVTGDDGFPLLWREVRIQILKFLGSNEENVIREQRLDVVVPSGYVVFRIFQGAVYFAYSILKSFHVALFSGDDLLPVPLIHIE